MNRVPNNQPVSYSVYKAAICNALPVPNAFIEAQTPRITRAFEAGEPLWMIIASTKMVWEITRGKWQKSPRQLAKEVHNVTV